MMLCVNTALKMGTGKIGAQCAHAAVGAVSALQGPKGRARLRQWEECGQAKICLKVSTARNTCVVPEACVVCIGLA